MIRILSSPRGKTGAKLKSAATGILLGLWASVSPVSAQEQHQAQQEDQTGHVQARSVVLVELYTSQGCSSCPPADAMIKQLAQREDLLALSLHVDYWDYLGWKDELANPAYTLRQKSYARVARKRMVYTPQMIVQGRDHVIGAHAMELMDAVDAHRSAVKDIPLALSYRVDGRDVEVSATPLGPLPKEMVIQLVRFRPLVTASIGRGENAGKTIDYANVVTGLKDVSGWNGASPVSIALQLEGDDHAAIVVQAKGPGSVVGVMRLPPAQ